MGLVGWIRMQEQFIHRYRYDASNRLTHVLTSTDNLLWHCDARYFYYPHGPLARMELGEKQVQGLDYAYTLQGWLKAVNGYRNNPNVDMGHDGLAGNRNTNRYFPIDQFSTSLYYYRNDYAPIIKSTEPFVLQPTDWTPLYSGNIAALSTHLTIRGKSMLKVFRYDKINRIKEMKVSNLLGNPMRWDNTESMFATNYTYDFNGNILSLRRNNATSATMHNLKYSYGYEQHRNRLLEVEGLEAISTYTYDNVGNLASDASRFRTKRMAWNSAGKVTSVVDAGTEMRFAYSPTGQRQMKKVKVSNVEAKTYYLHDATGNIMATYTLESNRLTVNDLYLYGSSRLGSFTMNERISNRPIDPVPTNRYSRTIGARQFELTDHLGNVMVTVSDLKAYPSLIVDTVYQAQYLSFTDYYPFGYPIAERSSNSADYRFGFNGQEKDDEIYGEGASYTAEFWQYDSRLGRRWNVDPVLKPWESPYATFANNPIAYIDPNGRDFKLSITRNESGEITGVEVQAKIYITGAKASAERAMELNKLAKETFNSENIDGVNVSFNITYEYMENTSDLTLGEGENLLTFKDEKGRSEVAGSVKKLSSGITIYYAGNKGLVYSNGDNKTVMHETGHFLGLPDRYDDFDMGGWGKGSAVHEGFENDIMGSSRNSRLVSFHHKQYLKEAKLYPCYCDEIIGKFQIGIDSGGLITDFEKGGRHARHPYWTGK